MQHDGCLGGGTRLSRVHHSILQKGKTMKKLLLVLSLMVLAFAFARSSFSAPQAHEDDASNQWLFKNLQKIQTIKVGTTRKEVDKLFTTPGGAQAKNPLMLVYRKSPYIFVRVNYETSHDAQGRVQWSPDDKVVSISEPYLQHWTYID
jgi:hypothetical protein